MIMLLLDVEGGFGFDGALAKSLRAALMWAVGVRTLVLPHEREFQLPWRYCAVEGREDWFALTISISCYMLVVPHERDYYHLSRKL